MADAAFAAFVFGRLHELSTVFGEHDDDGIIRGKQVTAFKDFVVGQCVLFPATLSPSHIMLLEGSRMGIHPNTVRIPCCSQSGEWVITPSTVRGRLPSDSFLPPVWAMRRSRFRDESNMELVAIAVESACTHTGKFMPSGGTSTFAETHIPIAHNHRNVELGAELVLYDDGPFSKPDSSSSTSISKRHGDPDSFAVSATKFIKSL